MCVWQLAVDTLPAEERYTVDPRQSLREEEAESRGHMLPDSVHMTFPERQQLQTEHRSGFPREWG